MVRIIITLGYIVLIISACSPSLVHNKSDFNLKENTHNFNNQLLTGGYYYNIYNRNKDSKKGYGTNIKILLTNGYVYIAKNGFGNQCGNIVTLQCELKMSEMLMKEYLLNDNVNRKGPLSLWNWGRYRIENKQISIQTFYNYFGDYYVLEEKGVLLNDRTFKINQELDYRTGKEKKVDKLYLFNIFDIENIYKKIPDNKVFK